MDTWDREEHTQIQENRLLLEKASALISQKAYGFIDQAIEQTLQDWGLGDVQIEDGGLSRGPRGGLIGEKGVSVLEYRALTIYTQPVTYRASRY